MSPIPWHLERREGKVCVIKDADGSTAGCHDSRTSAVKQMRALYANESRMASMYAELDARPEEVLPEEEVKSNGSELVRIEIGKEHDHLIASLSDRLDAMAQRESETQQALVAALQQIGMREPVVNVEAPNVNVEPPEVNIQPPAVTVEAPLVTVEGTQVNVPAPEINVILPEEKRPRDKKVSFLRDPLGRLEGAEVSE